MILDYLKILDKANEHYAKEKRFRHNLPDDYFPAPHIESDQVKSMLRALVDAVNEADAGEVRE